MGLGEVLAVAVALGCDAFAVGLGVGARCRQGRQRFRLSFHFGLFQALMPLLGWLGGRQVASLAATYAVWVGFAVLVFLGGRMAWEGLRPGGGTDRSDPTKGISLVALSLATSIDALGVGFTLGILGRPVVLPSLVIGLVAAAMTLLAMRLGGALSARFGRAADVAGGLILMAIAFKLVLT